MAGLYIHIPFCRKACHFCNFHFSTSLKQKDRMLTALLKEVEMRQDFLPGKKLESIYLGGGTPSVLNAGDLDRIFQTLSQYFEWTDYSEITLEANPDDLSVTYLRELAASPVNRLSIGLQSLDQQQLEWMNRSHTADQSIQCIPAAMDMGFSKITVDWIYGFPGLSEGQLLQQLQWTSDQGISHFSAYALTVEKGTVLDYRIQKGIQESWSDELSRKHFELIMEWAASNGYEHYEISNFARPGFRAVHNSAYWHDEPYLGIGPSAHSYRGRERLWNPSHNAQYLRSIEDGQLPLEREYLSDADRFNEWVMTRLRLKEGLSLQQLDQEFSDFKEYFQRQARQSSIKDWIQWEGDTILLTREGKHFADRVASELFY